jgi:uncharacterized membrane protein YccC
LTALFLPGAQRSRRQSRRSAGDGYPLQRLAQGEPVALPQGEVEKAPLLAPDAWRNPAYLHFALKTLLATLICYVFYTAADWQGCIPLC